MESKLKTFSNNSDRIQYLQQQTNYKDVKKLPTIHLMHLNYR
jgi:hypothetical protein